MKCVLVLSGSFNPPTNAHLSLLSMARNAVEEKGYQVVKAKFVPTHGSYDKPGLANSKQRLDMCKLTCKDSDWIEADSFEVDQPQWTDCLTSLKHQQSLYPDCKIFYVCGSDLVLRWNNPIWPEQEVIEILTDFGIVMFSRNTNVDQISNEVPVLKNRTQNVVPVTSNPMYEISSTLVRDLIKSGKHATGFIAPLVENYIFENSLYK